MSGIYQTHRRKIIGAAVGIAALSYFNPFNTPAVGAIEKRYSSGGATPTHTPGVATTRGKSGQVHGNQEKHSGVGTPEWEEKIGGQKPDVGSQFFRTLQRLHNVLFRYIDGMNFGDHW